MIKFKSQNDIAKIELKNSKGLKFRFLENGAIFSIMHGQILINQILGNPLEGSLNNIYIRIHDVSKISYFPILGPESNSEFYSSIDQLVWKGKADNIEYECILSLDEHNNIWLWDIDIKNVSDLPKKVDVVFSQDIGIANIKSVRVNEAYTSQYIDHKIFDHEDYGYIICSRQNQPQSGKHPWIMHGTFNRAKGYLTDGFQFFGLNYKETNIPESLILKNFPNKNLQYEFALPSLVTDIIKLEKNEEEYVTFYSLYFDDHKEATKEKDLTNIGMALNTFNNFQRKVDLTSFKKIESKKNIFNNITFFKTNDLSNDDVEKYFDTNIRHVETENKKLLSFFYGDNKYVALKEKELKVMRPHGHIIRSGKDIFPTDELLSSTSYMYGIFNSQLTIGNTSFNKLLSVSRNHLNVLKACGQRIFVKMENGYELLGLPSAYEVGINHSKWIYKGEKETIVVKVWSSMDDPACFLEIESENYEREFIIVSNIVLGNNELDSNGQADINKEKKTIKFVPDKKEYAIQKYPNMVFYMVMNQPDKIKSIDGDMLIFEDGQPKDHSYIIVKSDVTKKLTFTFTGNIIDSKKAVELTRKYEKNIYTYEDMLSDSNEFWSNLSNKSKIIFEDKNEDIDKLNDIIPWYSYSAMVHFTIPHGLEQYSGAAWGVRDVCQGPVEYLYATKNYKYIKQTLNVVFSHQYKKRRDWPQWFMFDRFNEVQQNDCHGDIIIWPLKALCDYIEVTNDFDYLDEKLSYIDDNTYNLTSEKETIFEHAKKIIDKIEEDCIKDTALLCYGDGDWDDTLQPADPEMKKQMVSGWTVELIYQTYLRYQRVCEKAGKSDIAMRIKDFAERLKEDFNKYIVKDGVVSGFVYFHGKDDVENMLHPSGSKTGIKYRLLPMIRGMISTIFTKEQVKKHFNIIKKELFCPDGVRLMDRPAKYNGGTQKYFKRAETAANFGREIGLQYVHAHIRFIEAMAKLGKADELYNALLVINPINITKSVNNAGLRQSNAYFSSSDGDFMDRYQAMKEFNKIKSGNVKVKGGWRIYSSGPGIYLNQLISNFLGIRELFNDVLIDPVIPKKLNGLIFESRYNTKKIKYKYIIKENSHSPKKVLINGENIEISSYDENPYRKGGALIDKKIFEEKLNSDNNMVEIYM